MKTRNSNGVGQKIDLEYNIDTMRITDPGIDESADAGKAKPSKIFENLKRQSTVSAVPNDALPPHDPVTGEVKADVNSSKLKQMLAAIKSSP